MQQDDELQGWSKNIQLMQNKLLRFLNGTVISDKVNTNSILNNLNLLSVNQMNAQAKLNEAWKINNITEYPIKWELKHTDENERQTRATSANNIPEKAKSKLTQSSLNNDAKKLWNKAPGSIKLCINIKTAEKAIKTFVKTLPM